MLGNKGAVGIAFNIGETSLLFINSHLTAHYDKLAERNADFARIMTDLPLKENYVFKI